MPSTFWRISAWLPLLCRSCAVQIPFQWLHKISEKVLHWIHWWVQQSDSDDGNFGWHLWNGNSLASKMKSWFCHKEETALNTKHYFVHKEWDDEKLNDPDVQHMLKSFRWIRCSYTHFMNPSQHPLLSLRTSIALNCIDEIQLLTCNIA